MQVLSIKKGKGDGHPRRVLPCQTLHALLHTTRELTRYLMRISYKKFAQIPIDMFYSDAYQSLNKPSTTMLTYILFQFEIKKTSNRKSKPEYVLTKHDEILLLYSVFKKQFNIGKSSMTRSIDSLLACGFITVKEKGGREKGHNSIYSYTEKWKTWKKGDQPIEVRTSSYERGFTKKNKEP